MIKKLMSTIEILQMVALFFRGDFSGGDGGSGGGG